MLPSWTPQTLDELAELAPRLPYPVLIKPRTHVNRLRNDKGVVVRSAEELKAEYPRFLAREQRRYDDSLRELDAVQPVIQKFVEIGREGVVSISGFVGRSADVFVTRRSTKIFQRSRPVGVGVCYESCEADPALSEAVRRICGELAYFGLFEVEFILHDGAWTIIDFNPRLFNQIGLDLRRGMPLPMLAYPRRARRQRRRAGPGGRGAARDRRAKRSCSATCSPCTRSFWRRRCACGRASRISRTGAAG